MSEEIKEEKKEAEAPSAPTEKPAEEKPKEEEKPAEETPKDPVKDELEKIDKGKKKYTKRERLNFEKNKIDEQINALDEEDGITPEVKDDTPVTVGMLDKREKEAAQTTAIALAEAIEDENERKLTIHYLENRIKPSGDAEADVRLARAAVNSLRNGQIAEEVDRKKNPNRQPSAPGAPGDKEKAFKPTDQERMFMQPPYNLTKEDVIKSREREDAARE